MPVSFGQILSIREISRIGCHSGVNGAKGRGVAQPHQRHLVCLGSPVKLGHWRRYNETITKYNVFHGD